MPSPPHGKVTLAWIHPRDVSHLWATSMRNLRIMDLATSRHTHHTHGELWILCAEGAPSDSRATARNIVTSRFMAESEAEWLCWIDTDMGFAHDTLDRLLAAADPVERPIVGALCFSLAEAGPSSFGGHRTLIAPTVYDRADSGSGLFTARIDYGRDAVVRCDATGSACVLIHRSVLTAISERWGPVWYKQAPNPLDPSKALGEDISFCLRATECGFPVHVDTSVKTTHDKGGVMFLDEALYLDQQRLAPPPATEEALVIVPVLHRPQNIAPLMESLRASTGMAHALFVCEEGDRVEADEVGRCGGSVLFRSGTFAQKVNQAVARFPGKPWYFLCGDDVRFHPGWLDHALDAARRTGAKVVGTNDLANSRATRGDHATHMLIAADYIRDVGASWDGPGVVCHEGYRHWFVDDEIVTAAKQRGVWTPCLASVVEHLHPIAGKAADDDVYRLGRSEADADRRRFTRRLLAHAS